jgi:thiol-disulfide isomerase/thioredoxin
MRKKITGCFLFLFALVFFLLSSAQTVRADDGEYPLTIYFFYGEGCPHCAQARPFLESLAKKYPGVTLKSYEVYFNEVNRDFFYQLADRYNIEVSGVPTMFYGEYYLVGYTDDYQSMIEEAVVTCIQNGCPDYGADIAPLLPNETPLTTQIPTETPVTQETPQPTLEIVPTPFSQDSTQYTNPQVPYIINLPLIGEVDLSQQSLLLSTVLIAAVDSFNPCALWVLSMLLVLTIHTGSRKKVLWIGLVFLTVSAVVYALFIAGLFSVLRITSYLNWIQVILAVITLLFGIINIKDYFFFKEGPSLTISRQKQKGIIQKITAVMDASQSFWAMTGATIILAIGVSLIEFSCTAGFPVVWTNLLTAKQVTGTTFLILLLIYMLIYQIEGIIMFLVAVFSLRAARLEEKHGRILKLVGGALMLSLSLVLLINPVLLNDLGNTLLVFLLALGAAGLILIVHRLILPGLGVRVGTGLTKDKDK